MKHDIGVQFFQIVSDMRQHLTEALDSLGGKDRNGLWDSFLGFSAAHINRAAHGYVHLRQAPMIDASKLLIRPALETMFRIQAVRAKPSLLYRIAYTEWTEDRKLVRPAARRLGQDSDTEFQRSWEDFTLKYSSQFPGHSREEATLSAFQAAEAAGVEDYYDCAYRLYCQFTHGALRATSGDLHSTDALDSRTMAFCVLSALEAVASIGGDAPQMIALRDRLLSLTRIDSEAPDTR